MAETVRLYRPRCGAPSVDALRVNSAKEEMLASSEDSLLQDSSETHSDCRPRGQKEIKGGLKPQFKEHSLEQIRMNKLHPTIALKLKISRLLPKLGWVRFHKSQK